jgi:hypothetical protein
LYAAPRDMRGPNRDPTHVGMPSGSSYRGVEELLDVGSRSDETEGADLVAEVLTIVWFAAAIGGVVAAVCALMIRTRRRASLMLAGVCFGVAGVLGILSVGIVLLALSVACFVTASRTGSASAAATSDV